MIARQYVLGGYRGCVARNLRFYTGGMILRKRCYGWSFSVSRALRISCSLVTRTQVVVPFSMAKARVSPLVIPLISLIFTQGLRANVGLINVAPWVRSSTSPTVGDGCGELVRGAQLPTWFWFVTGQSVSVCWAKDPCARHLRNRSPEYQGPHFDSECGHAGLTTSHA